MVLLKIKIKILVFLLLFLTGKAMLSAEFTWLPGSAKDVNSSISACRDTPSFEYAYGPRVYSTMGLEWGWFKIEAKKITYRLGMYGFIGLENHQSKNFFWPSALWRAQAGLNFSFSLTTLAERMFNNSGAFELSISMSHESSHGDFNEPLKENDIPAGGMGDFITPELALWVKVWKYLIISGKIYSHLFVQGDLIAVPTAELSFRFIPLKYLHPFISVCTEGIFPKDNKRKGYNVKILSGISITGKFGDFIIFISFESGNGRGLLINRQENRFIGGIRYTPFTKK